MKKNFSDVYRVFLILTFGMFVVSILRIGYGSWRTKSDHHSSGRDRLEKDKELGLRKLNRTTCVLWGAVAALFLLQMFCVFYLAYEEGDDAFYVAITTMSEEANRLYTKIPYTGAFTELAGRYSLAPFPVWVAVLGRMADLSGATTSHLVMPVFVILMAYTILYLIGDHLIGREDPERSWKLPFYLFLMELLVIFGGYSTYTRENFLLVRACQGKAVLANVIIPFLFYLLLLLMEKLEHGGKTGIRIWIAIALALVAGCLCSTLGTFLLCMLLVLGVFCGAVVYRRWSLLGDVIPCLLIPAGIVLLYLKL